MAPVTFTLVALKSDFSSSFIEAIKSLPASEKPLWLGRTHHWIHEPALDTAALLGPQPEIYKWDYLLITNSTIPGSLDPFIDRSWSISANTPSEQVLLPRSQAVPPTLPTGWSSSDPSTLEAATPPADLEASLALSSRPFNTSTTLPLKSFIKSFDTKPVFMFGLLAYNPDGGREKYFKYVDVFTKSVGADYGGEAKVLGFGIKGGGEWEDAALIGYPSLWHFAAMLDSEAYGEADRRFKGGSLRGNPLLCCTEVEV